MSSIYRIAGFKTARNILATLAFGLVIAAATKGLGIPLDIRVGLAVSALFAGTGAIYIANMHDKAVELKRPV